MSLATNIIANYGGQVWRAIMQLAFIPLYIKYLGLETYGLIGVFAILLACLGLLDSWMRPALGREMARFTAGAHTVQSIRDLLRSIELLGLAAAVLLILSIWWLSAWLAAHWIRADGLPQTTIATAISLMGIVAALRLLESIYVSTISGLQHQVSENLITGIMATARGLGVLGILVWISPTIEAFLLWQGLISLLTVGLFYRAVHNILPRPIKPPRFTLSSLRDIRQFASGIFVIAFLSLLLTQVDKVLLSKLLTLESFAYYALAGVVANALYMLAQPLTSAFYPRFAELVTQGDESALRASYHRGAQLVTLFMGTAAVFQILYSDRLLLIWTQDAALAHQVSPLLKVLALGTLLNGLMWMPYQLQLAHGWTALTVRINIVATTILIPSILWVVPIYGSVGAAIIWVVLNSFYLLFAIHLMHRRLLISEKWKWYLNDVFTPLSALSIILWLCREAIPPQTGVVAEIGVFLFVITTALLTGILAAPTVRREVSQYLRTPSS